jgi:transmembrane sensor
MTERTNLMQRIGHVGAQINSALSDDDVERLVQGSHQRRRRKAVTRICLASALAGVAVVVVARALPLAPPARTASGTPVASAVPQPAGQVRFSDGSVATRLDPQSTVTVVEDTPRRVALDLGRGRQRFEVVPMPERSFVVRAGDVSVTVVGTVFAMERVADRIGVTVERGRVLVDWRSGSRMLGAGESGWFPPLVIGDPPLPEPGVAPERARLAPRPGQAVTAPPAVRPPEPGPIEAAAAPPRPPSSVETAAAPPRPPSIETAESLLGAADAAREAGRTGEGVALLRRVLAQHRSDPRAPLAAFTLGRVLLMELDRPREAAVAFAEVRALAPQGPFAEDALAREVEALRKAGAAGEARERAREYLRLYPGGRRIPAVKAFGGDE